MTFMLMDPQEETSQHISLCVISLRNGVILVVSSPRSLEVINIKFLFKRLEILINDPVFRESFKNEFRS